MVLEGILGKKREEKTPSAPQNPEPLAREKETQNAKLELQARYYRKIIERYAALVNENEEKTIPELKARIDKNDAVVLGLRSKVLEEVSARAKASGAAADWQYDYERDFLFAAESSFACVRAIGRVHPEVSVSFWLAPKDIMEIGAADVFDKAILLCSLLNSLGASSKILVLELENNMIHPVVALEYSGKGYLIDSSQPDSALSTYCGPEEEVLKGFAFDSNKFIKKSYEFDREDYREFEEAGANQ